MCLGLEKYVLKNGFRYMLLNPLLQPLQSTTHIATITVAQKLIHYVALLVNFFVKRN